MKKNERIGIMGGLVVPVHGIKRIYAAVNPMERSRLAQEHGIKYRYIDKRVVNGFMRDIKMHVVCGFGGFSGWEDDFSPIYSVLAKRSNWATPEQNQKLERELLIVYRDYLLAIAEEHNGMY